MCRYRSLSIMIATCAAMFQVGHPGRVQAQASLGAFESHQDVGTVLTPGTAEYDASKKTYSLSASGENMWATADAFQFVWNKMSGDMRISADIAFVGTGGDPHRKAVLIVRQTLDADSPYADVALHGVGLTSLQSREEKGIATHEIESAVSGPKRVMLEKRGQYFYMYVAGEGEGFKFAGGTLRVPIEGTYYAGIGLCAHNKDAVERAVFSNVRIEPITKPVAQSNLALYSTLETVTVTSTDRRVATVSANRIESPVWLKEGDALVYQSAGKSYRVPVAGGTSVITDAPAAPGEEHSADGKYVYFTSAKGGSMQVWRKTADGAEEQVTADDFANWFPHVSPDGGRIVMLSTAKTLAKAPANQEVTLRMLTLATQRTTVLAKILGGQGSIDAPSWSPEGRRVAFVSYQWMPKGTK